MKRIEREEGGKKGKTILYIAQPILISRQSARATFCTQLNPTANINYGRAKKLLIRHRATKPIRANGRGDRIGETRTFGLKLFAPRNESAVSRISFNIAIASIYAVYLCTRGCTYERCTRPDTRAYTDERARPIALETVGRR